MKLPIFDKQDGTHSTGTIRRIVVLLTPEFALMSYSSAIEPFRAANKLSGSNLYVWSHVSPDGQPVRASNGVMIVPDSGTRDGIEGDLLIVCAGGNPAGFQHPPTFAFLREAARSRIPIAGVSGGPLLMARAGLLDGYRCTIHWEHAPAFAEEFPQHDLRRSIFEVDRDRLTCAGGTAALDMMHGLIAREHGSELANAMAEWFLHTHVRESGDTQRMPVRERLQVKHPKLVKVLETMETSLENPKGREKLAQTVSISVRQLERLFRSYLGRSISDHYMSLRLRRARILLMQSTLSIMEVAVATGFVSASHFSRTYRRCFGHPPRNDQNARSG